MRCSFNKSKETFLRELLHDKANERGYYGMTERQRNYKLTTKKSIICSNDRLTLGMAAFLTDPR